MDRSKLEWSKFGDFWMFTLFPNGGAMRPHFRIPFLEITHCGRIEATCLPSF
jgi:hypothetical protein